MEIRDEYIHVCVLGSFGGETPGGLTESWRESKGGGSLEVETKYTFETSPRRQGGRGTSFFSFQIHLMNLSNFNTDYLLLSYLRDFIYPIFTLGIRRSGRYFKIKTPTWQHPYCQEQSN